MSSYITWYKLSLVSLILFVNVSCSYTFKELHDRLSLTLIPPTPVTDQINLDVRAGIWNNGESTQSLDVEFYLDSVGESSLLFEKRVKINAESNVGVSFKWPTKDHSGDRRIILRVDNGRRIISTERKIRILKSNKRSTERIDGAWFGFYHWSETEGRYWNAELKKATDEQWEEMMENQSKLGMNIIVIQDVIRNPNDYAGSHHIEDSGYQGMAYYPSDFVPKRFPLTAKDPLEAVLHSADINNMHVFVGVGMYAWFDFTPGSLEWHKKLADELWENMVIMNLSTVGM